LGTSREDDALMERLRTGDVTALDPLYRRYRGIVAAVVQQSAGAMSVAEVDDVCQETFLTLMDTAKRYRPGNALRGWLCGIALHKARRVRERSGARAGLLARFFRRKDAVVEPREGAGDVERLLQQLPQAQREVIILSVVEQLSAEDVAHALGISVNTVWTRLHRAREKLRELLAKEPA
jgi:RNA polymerase sigma-70 factor (ECF subfamily)